MFKLSCFYPGAAKGCQITIPNGYTVSIQWGPGNYCDNYSSREYAETAPNSTQAETAIIGPDGKFHAYKGDSVQGYQSPTDVLETINYAASLSLKEKAK